MSNVVDLDELKRCMKFLDDVNDMEFNSIEWQRDGVKVEPPELSEELWGMIGLNNVWYAKLYLMKEADCGQAD